MTTWSSGGMRQRRVVVDEVKSVAFKRRQNRGIVVRSCSSATTHSQQPTVHMLWQHRTIEARSRSGHLHRQTHVSRTVSSCFAALRQIKSSQPVLLSLVSSLFLSRLDYGSTVLSSISRQLMDRLVSAQRCSETYLQPSQVRPCYSAAEGTSLAASPQANHLLISLLFLAVLVFKCCSKTAPQYLAHDLQWAADDDSRTRLRSAASNKLIVRRCALSLE